MAAAKRSTQRRPVQPVQHDWIPWVSTLSILTLLCAAMAGAYLYLSQPGRMPLRVVEVNGAFRHLDQTAIRETASRAIDGGFFDCDMQKLREAVLAMPWVADVSVRRVWPDKLSMRVIEQVPVARWGEDALISGGARVFRPQALSAYADLIKLHGPAGSEQRVLAFFRSAQAVAGRRGLHVRAIDLDRRRHWWVHFDDGLTVSLGQEQRHARLAQFLRVYPRLISDPTRRPVRVDMRYAHGFAVRWQKTADDESLAAEQAAQEKV